MWGVHHAVVGIDILAAAADLRAHDDAAVTVLHLAVADDDVFARHITLTAVAVTAALDSDAVIAGIEIAIFDEHAVTTLRVTSVTVRTVIIDMYATYGDIC